MSRHTVAAYRRDLRRYAAYLAAARELRHDIEALAARFGVSFEQAAHRLSTLQREGARGVPLFFLRVDPAGNVLTDGITWNSPERLTVDDPLPGTWQVVVAGFTIYRADGRADVPGDPTGRVDEFALRATVDGRRLSARRPPSSR